MFGKITGLKTKLKENYWVGRNGLNFLYCDTLEPVSEVSFSKIFLYVWLLFVSFLQNTKNVTDHNFFIVILLLVFTIQFEREMVK